MNDDMKTLLTVLAFGLIVLGIAFTLAILGGCQTQVEPPEPMNIQPVSASEPIKYGDFTMDDYVGMDDYVWVLSHWDQIVDGGLIGADSLVMVLNAWGVDYTGGDWFCPSHAADAGYEPTGTEKDKGPNRACQVCGQRYAKWKIGETK